MRRPTYGRGLQSLARPFDVVVLGMGEDGHFASLFPGNRRAGPPRSMPAAAPACVAMRAPVEPSERISLNLAALLQTRRLFLFITGAAQTRAGDRLLRRLTRASRWPVSALLAQHAPVTEVYWAP